MGKFNILGVQDRYIEVVGENKHDYLLNYIKYDCNDECEKQETMSKVLFEFCVNSGYFIN